MTLWSAFTIMPVGPDVVIKFKFGGKVQMALLPMVGDNESWSKEWVRVRAHISESFRLSADGMELSYVDDDQDKITLYLFIFVLALSALNAFSKGNGSLLGEIYDACQQRQNQNSIDLCLSRQSTHHLSKQISFH